MAIEYDTTTKEALTNQKGSTSFLCPNCGKYTIRRSKNSREKVVKYTCPECGFEGPN